jgi:hypothetical protein
MSYLGLVVLFGLYCVIGLAVLCLLKLVSLRRLSVWEVPLAVLVGWAALGVTLSIVLMVGGDVVDGLILAFVLSVVALVGSTRRHSRSAVRQARQRVGRLEVAGLAVLGVLCLMFVGKGVFWNGSFHIDVWSFWIPKAKSIYFYRGLDTGPGGFTSWVSPDYPPMKPAVDATVFTAARHADPLLLPVHYTLLDVFFLWALLGLFRRRIGNVTAVAACLAIAALPGVINLVGSSLGDESLALAIAMAVTLLAVQAGERDERVVILAGLFLTAATLLKNEGAMLSLATVVAVGATGLVRGIRPLTVLAAGPAAAAVSWKVWLSTHHVPANPAYRLTNLLHPVWLIHHTHVLKNGVVALAHQSASFRWALIVPACFLLGLWLWRESSRVAAFAALVLPLWLLGYTAIYWVSLNTSWNPPAENSQRIYAPVAIAAAALTPLVFASLRPTRTPLTHARIGREPSAELADVDRAAATTQRV